MPDKKRNKTTVRYEIRYKCAGPTDRSPDVSNDRQHLNFKTDTEALIEFRRYVSLSEYCSEFKLIKITRTVKSYSKKRIITIVEECIKSDEI